MVKDSQARLEPLQVGNNVTIPIPQIDLDTQTQQISLELYWMSILTSAELELLLDYLEKLFSHSKVAMCAQKLPQEENSVIVF